VVQDVKIVGERNWKSVAKDRKKVGKNIFIRPRLTEDYSTIDDNDLAATFAASNLRAWL
jgi:hypothetical protein